MPARCVCYPAPAVTLVTTRCVVVFTRLLAVAFGYTFTGRVYLRLFYFVVLVWLPLGLVTTDLALTYYPFTAVTYTFTFRLPHSWVTPYTALPLLDGSPDGCTFPRLGYIAYAAHCHSPLHYDRSGRVRTDRRYPTPHLLYTPRLYTPRYVRVAR